MSEIKLKPCPFCGGEADVIREIECIRKIYYIDCARCSVSTQNYRSVEEAAESWNRRVSEEKE